MPSEINSQIFRDREECGVSGTTATSGLTVAIECGARWNRRSAGPSDQELAMNESIKPNSGELTRLLIAWSGGDAAALEQLAPLVYLELHRLAHHYMNRERAGHPLQTTA